MREGLQEDYGVKVVEGIELREEMKIALSDVEKMGNDGGFQLPRISCVRNWTFLAINPTV